MTKVGTAINSAFERRAKRLAEKIRANPKLYYEPKPLRPWTPEEAYKNLKQQWYFHESSGYMNQDNPNWKGPGCTPEQCIPSCRYYAETGTIIADWDLHDNSARKPKQQQPS